jgi:glutamate carboxypeptidase
MRKNSTELGAASGNMPRLLLEARKREAKLVERLRTLVEIESPSGDKGAVDRAQTSFAAWAVVPGGKIRRHKHRDYGDSLEVHFDAGSSRMKPILLLGHLDAVWDHGTLACMPWKVTRDVIAGPGVLDMKAGVMMALTAVEMLKDLQLLPRPITLLLHGDEEIRSPASRRITEEVAKPATPSTSLSLRRERWARTRQHARPSECTA